VVDVGSGRSRICAASALASCAQYVFLCPSLKIARQVQAEMRPKSHLFICERVRFATPATFASKVQTVAMFQDRSAVLIINMQNSRHSESDLLRLQSCAAAVMMQGSLLLYIDCGLSASVDLNVATHVENGTRGRWLLIHKGPQLKVLQLSA
jgi:hypothetical protein